MAQSGTSNPPPVISTSGSGQPGTPANIRIRGIGSVNAGNNPLIIIDGVQVHIFLTDDDDEDPGTGSGIGG